MPSMLARVPAPQTVQTELEVLPVSDEYFPTSQPMHDPESGKPVVVAYVPAEQATQDALLLSPVAVE
jgi:hypothetical protein